MPTAAIDLLLLFAMDDVHSPPPPGSSFMITENSNFMITENGNLMITE